ncbi:hypothetical protein L2D01_13055 [Hyphomonadaceae bacterium ML37]|nr:hypothetical protein L2D01_13055 [Hyphomonadaceae bacterium ML37]
MTMFRVLATGLLLAVAAAASHAQTPDDDIALAERNHQLCQAGDKNGCANLGIQHVEGRSVTQDGARAVELFRQACEGGSPDGCHNLAVSY